MVRRVRGSGGWLLLGVLGGLALLAPPPAEATFLLDGDLTAGDSTFNRPQGFNGLRCTPFPGAFRFDTFPVIGLAGEVRIETTLGTLTDSVLVLYRGGFNPAAPCTNFVATNDDSGGGRASLISGTVAPGNYTIVVTSFAPGQLGTYSLRVTNDVPAIITGPGAGGGPHVRGFNQSGAPIGVDFFPYPGPFTGGVFPTTGLLDVATDFSRKIITGSGPGIPARVRAFNRDGSDFGVNFQPYGGFTGGVRVAACPADSFPTGTDNIITAAGPGGGPHVIVWRVDPVTKAATIVTQFFAYPAGFTGGVWVACAAGVNNAGAFSFLIITGADTGGGPHVRVWELGAGPGFAVTEVFGFLAFAPSFTGGVRVAAGDVDGDSLDEIVVGAGPGGGPHVQVLRVFQFSPPFVISPTVLASFFPYAPGFAGGVFVAAGDLGGIGSPATVITGAGAGGGPHVRAFEVTGINQLFETANFFAYSPSFGGGVPVAAGFRSFSYPFP